MEKSNDSNLHVRWGNLNFRKNKINSNLHFQGLELHAMCFVFKTAVVFLCKERLRQKKKSLIVRFLWKYCNWENEIFLLQGTSSKSSAAEVEIIRYQVETREITLEPTYLIMKYFLNSRFWFLWQRYKWELPILRTLIVTTCGNLSILKIKFNEETRKSTICQIGR